MLPEYSANGSSFAVQDNIPALKKGNDKIAIIGDSLC
jgi:hypothetical protein